MMRILLPTGAVTEQSVRIASGQYDADVVVTGELASFLTPGTLEEILSQKKYDMVIVSGMCTASFLEVEEKTGVPIYRGPRHAADLGMILPLLGKIELSRDIPADDLLVNIRKREAYTKLSGLEKAIDPDILIRALKIGGGSRIKVLAEVMDAHKRPDIRVTVSRYFEDGADIVDLGFGFDATPEDVSRVFRELSGIDGPLAVDTQDPDLIRAALFRADLILSLQEKNIPLIGSSVAEAGAVAVVVPSERSLTENIRAAQEARISSIIADPLLQPVGSGLVRSLGGFQDIGFPIFFGAGNVIELIDADSVGIAALLAGMAREVGSSVIFCSEHSDKTRGCIAEMRKATEMMMLMGERPYPKDLGIDLFSIKEKRRRREPPLQYTSIRDADQMPEEISFDPAGNFRIGIEDGYIVAVRRGHAIRGRRWVDVFTSIMAEGGVTLLDHAAYLGEELYKAELALRFNRSFEQDGPF